MERLKELLPLWTVLAFFAAGFGALGSISPEGTPFENHAATLRMVCYGAVVVCLVIGGLALILERLQRFSKDLGRGIGACAKFVRENALFVAALVAVTLLLWRLFGLGRDPAVFSIVPLLVVACIALTIGLIRLLAMARPSFLGLAAARTDLWRYDFIDHFAEANQRRHQGSDIEIHDSAICDNQTMRAIFEHPPDRADKITTLTYGVMIPSRLSLVELTGFIGIEEARPTPEGLVRSKRTLENAVQFKILIDDKEVFQKCKETSQWERFSILVHGRDDTLSVSFVTNNLGENAFNWAVWGEPQLIEVTR